MSYLYSLLNAAAIYGALAVLQSLLLNRLGLAFAAMPAFLGLGAYALVLAGTSPAMGATAAGVALIAGIGMTALANRLRRDYYLLATLAILECLGAVFGASGSLGGREGLSIQSSSAMGGSGFEERFLPLTLGALLVVIATVRLVLGSGLGVAIDRMREHPDTASRWFPDRLLRRAVVAGSLSAAALLGALYVTYYGRVTPNIFSIQSAVLVLVFTVVGGRWPELAAVAALAYWALPYFLTTAFPMSERGASDFVRIVWGVLVVSTICAQRNYRIPKEPA